MGVPVLCIGKSGSGKSTSLRNFKGGELALINVLGKPLPFKNNIGSYTTDDYAKVKNAMEQSKINTIVIDDAGYLITNMFMRNHSSAGAGNSIFAFYNQLGDEFWNLIQFIIHSLPAKKIVYLMMHEEKNDLGDIKPKTIGKMLDEKVTIEGMFTIVLRAVREGGRYVFKTQSEGPDVAKSPMEMFPAEIDNDLKMVDKTIREYYWGTPKEEENHEEAELG